MWPDAAPYIQFFPSFRCTQECPFCFNRGIVPGGDIGVAEFTMMLDILASSGITEIDILGGEPTLHPGLERMIGAAAEKRMAVSLSSNGANPAMLSRLSERFGSTCLTVGVSLNNVAPDDELHRFICEGKPLLKGIASRDHFVAAAAERYLEEPDIAYFALFMDAVRQGDLDGSLSFSEYSARLAQARQAFPRMKAVYCGGFMPDLGRYPFLERARCPAGITKLSVTPGGDVYPCYLFFRHPEYRLGNLFRDDLREMMRHRSLAFFREFRGNRCPLTACGLFHDCHGGCPAVSLLCCGDVTAPDPRCVPSVCGR